MFRESVKKTVMVR